jgi:hypothetical protein
MRTLLYGTALAAAITATGCGREGGIEKAFKEFQSALKAKDGDKVWSLLAEETRGYFDKAGEAAAKDAASGAEGARPWAEFLECDAGAVREMSGKEMVKAHVERFPDRTEPYKNYFGVIRDAPRIYEIRPQLDVADAKMTVEEGKFQMIKFAFEDKRWKVVIDPKHLQFPKRNLR